MSIIESKIATTENLYWAWEKAKWFYKPGDIWFDEIEVAAFEANLHTELNSIRKDLISGNYKLNPIKPVAFPKKKNDEGTRTRQTFWISVRDQVTWLVIANFLGKFIDSKMPFWSYGNRLYISTFYENDQETGKPELKFGYYRNTSKYTFRKWSQSWPLYRKHIYITSKLLSRNSIGSELEFNENELDTIDVNKKFIKNHPLKVDYLNSNYWTINKKGELYWAGLDFSKFYPSVKTDSIIKNLKENFNFDSDLIDLIKNLLDFEIDFTGWNSADIEKLQLNKKDIKYHNIPTGLFIAGFLANVALIEVDNEISLKLRKNRKVAHFRYVDDHVILSTSFRELIRWIEDYKNILERVDVGADFNPDKTEPKELAEYFKSETKELSKSEQKKIYYKARDKSKLDPQFPAPLMTQTLAKVSHIAGTDFQLLDPEEEKSLISDIEHLLITEFPDQELRRDTRISFAARMLSTLVPQITTNSEKKFLIERNLNNLNKEYLKEKERLSEQKLQEKRLLLKDRISQIRIEIQNASRELETENGVLDNYEKQIVKRTVKLLKKAVRENHEKVRLWTRLIEFCFRSGGQIEVEIVKEMNKLIQDKESNHLSVSFIQSLITQVLSNLLITAYNTYVNNNTTNKSKEKALCFINSVLNENLFDLFIANHNSKELKFYERTTFDLFKFVSGTIIYLMLKSDFLDSKSKSKMLRFLTEYKLINWESNPILFTKKTSHNFSAWAWWLIKKLNNNKDLNQPPILYDKLLEYIDIKDEIGCSIIALYPRHIPRNLILEINRSDIRFPSFLNEGWLFDLKKGLQARNMNYKLTILTGINEKDKKYKNNISLDTWIEWTRNREIDAINTNSMDKLFDPRLGEWMALEITRQIAILIKNKTQYVSIFDLHTPLEYSSKIHPANFKVRKELKEIEQFSWEGLKKYMSENNVIEIKAVNDLLYDNRFSQPFGFDNEKEIESIINALGSILICLLSKSLDLPSNWNPIGHKFAWLNLSNNKLKYIPVSSHTRNVIAGCFSKRNIETKLLKSTQTELKYEIDDDSNFDPPIFINIDNLIRHIQYCQNLLEKNQLLISNNRPRQLTPMSFKQIKREYYENLTDE